MIDNLSILLSHVLIALAFWLLTMRDDLDNETPPAPDAEPEGFGASIRRKKPQPGPQLTPQSGQKQPLKQPPHA